MRSDNHILDEQTLPEDKTNYSGQIPDEPINNVNRICDAE